MLGSLILYLKGMRILMFQLSGIYHKGTFKAPKDASEVGIVVVARIQDILDPWEKGLGLRIFGFRVQGLGFID